MSAGLAWLWPGAGHIYQGRYAKGILYMVCILGTYFFGLTMGNGHVVYAAFVVLGFFVWMRASRTVDQVATSTNESEMAVSA